LKERFGKVDSEVGRVKSEVGRVDSKVYRVVSIVEKNGLQFIYIFKNIGYKRVK